MLTPEQKKEVVQLLEQGRTLLTDPKCWTQGAYTRDADGIPGGLGWEKTSTCWCTMGAVHKVSGTLGTANTIAYKAIWQLDQAMNGCAVEFNDTHTHEEVMAGWDRAIELAKQG